MTPPHPEVMLAMTGVDREMFTCRTRHRLPRRLSLYAHTRGANHPRRLTQRVRQQIKTLTLWRSTFYVPDFLAQPAMSSIKELSKVYLVFCNLSNWIVPSAWGIGPRWGQQPLDPITEVRGLRG
jgi:hypothetical protein